MQYLNWFSFHYNGFLLDINFYNSAWVQDKNVESGEDLWILETLHSCRKFSTHDFTWNTPDPRDVTTIPFETEMYQEGVRGGVCVTIAARPLLCAQNNCSGEKRFSFLPLVTPSHNHTIIRISFLVSLLIIIFFWYCTPMPVALSSQYEVETISLFILLVPSVTATEMNLMYF